MNNEEIILPPMNDVPTVGPTLFVNLCPTSMENNGIQCQIQNHHGKDLRIRNIQTENIHAAYDRADSFLGSFVAQISTMKISEENKNSVINLCKNLVLETKILSANLLENNQTGSTSIETVSSAVAFVLDKLAMHDSAPRRHQKCTEKQQYVKPVETAVGTRWTMKHCKESNSTVPKIVQSKLEYIPITESVKSYFKDEKFKKVYLDYNRSILNCPGIYKTFSDGENFKNNELFQKFPNSIQLQVATDDFEICDPLASRATVYKITAVYMRVINIPRKFLSKLNSIRLVCLSLTDDLKTQQTDFNNIWDLVARDITILETVGVDIDDINIKGTLVYLTFDNLGGNICLGMAESFNTHYYCRICECSKEQCKKLCNEITNEYRTKEKYSEQLKIIERSEKVNYKETKGIKRYCSLNDLSFFHIFINKTVDIMHDLLEGVIPHLLLKLFELGISNKIFTLKEIQESVEFFKFGFLHRANTPSQIRLDKSNLGQNSSQMKCLFLNIPFILWKYRKYKILEERWICVESLLRITETSFSDEITDIDIQRLENDISAYLENIQKLFGNDLLVKHHMLLHYPNIIRSMGPLTGMCMMRFEAKHKYFKDAARINKNFMNIPKTLAKKHQDEMAQIETIINENFSSTSHKPVPQSEFQDFINIFQIGFSTGSQLNETKMIQLNNFKYKAGLIVLFEGNVFEIFKIIVLDGKYKFWCFHLEMIAFDVYSNSLELRRQSYPNVNELIPFDDLKIRKSYETVSVDDKMYILANDLDLRHFFILNFGKTPH